MAEAIDVGIAAEAGKARHNPAVRTLGCLSEIADQTPSVIACDPILGCGLVTRRPRLAEAGAGMLTSVLVAAAFKSGLKALVFRTRPHAVMNGDAYAFETGGRDRSPNSTHPRSRKIDVTGTPSP